MFNFLKWHTHNKITFLCNEQNKNKTFHNMVIELVVTRTDLERNKFVDVDNSLRDAGEVFAVDE